MIDTDTLQTFLDNLSDPAPEVAPVVLPDGKTIAIVVRDDHKVERIPVGEVGQRKHAFGSVDSIAAFALRHFKPDSSDVFVDAARVTVHAEPGNVHGPIGTCAMLKHPRAARWLGVFGRPLTQRDLQRFLLTTNADFITEHAADGVVLGTEGDKLAGEIAKLNVRKIKSMDCHLNPNGMIVFAGASEETTINGKIPGRFVVTVPWFIGIKKGGTEALYDLTVDVEMDTDDDTVSFKLTCAHIAETEHGAVNDAALYLSSLLGDAWLVSTGAATIATAPKFLTPTV